MNHRTPLSAITSKVAPKDSPGTALQRRCACGQHTFAGECATCRQRESSLLRRTSSVRAPNGEAPPIVHQVLRSPGRPLNEDLRSELEPLFARELSQIKTHSGAPIPAAGRIPLGDAADPAEAEASRIAQSVVNRPDSRPLPALPASPEMDLSRVRVHTDARAAESACAVGALAYTVGDHVVFGSGQFAPQSPSGRLLLAHELAHVAQQERWAGPTSSPPLRRKSSPDLEKIRQLLSYDVLSLHLVITDRDATNALALLKKLPRFEKAVFIADRKFLDRLRENLPEESLEELKAVESEVTGLHPPTAAVGEIQKNLSTGIFELDLAVTDKEAVASLEVLKKLSDVELPIALDDIDTVKLMEELPDGRKPELQVLLKKGQRTKTIVERTALESITFVSDHGVLRENKNDLTDAGKTFSEPEWSEQDGKVTSNPISQTKGTKLKVDLALNLMPLDAGPSPITLRGESDSGFLSFQFTGTKSGGAGQRVQALEAREPTPDGILSLPGREIRWVLTWQGLDYEVARTRHTIYSTMGMPLAGVIPTEKRMATAVNLAMQEGPTLSPYQLVLRLMNKFKNYNLRRPRLANPWDLAETGWYGAQCIDIAEFVKGVLGVLGCPGALDAVMIWAHPDAPDDVKADDAATGRGTNGIPGRLMDSVQVYAALLDGGGLWNSFEAAIKYGDGSSTRYFPGGAESRDGYATPPEVLNDVFDCLAWIEAKTFPGCQIHKIARSYARGTLQQGQSVNCQTQRPK